VLYVKTNIQKMLKAGGLDTDGDGLISKKEFTSLLETVEASRLLTEVGVDVFSLVELADFIFEDEHAKDAGDRPVERDLTFTDFMNVILELRGSNAATVKDIVDLRKSTLARTARVEDALKCVETKIRSAFHALKSTRQEHVKVLDKQASLAAAEQFRVQDEPMPAVLPNIQEAPQDGQLLELNEPLECYVACESDVAPNAAQPALEHLRPELERLERLRHHVNTEMARIKQQLCKAETEAIEAVSQAPDVQTVSSSHAAAVASCSQHGSWVSASASAAVASASASAGSQMGSKEVAAEALRISESIAIAGNWLNSVPPAAGVATASAASASAVAGEISDAGSGAGVRYKATMNVTLEVITT